MRTVRFDRIRWSMDSDGTWLSLRVPNRQQATAACELVEEGKLYDAVLKLHREKRSLDANAYCWVLIGKLAEHYAVPPDTIYRREIRNVGSFTVVAVPSDMLPAMASGWTEGHIGRMADDLGPCRSVAGRSNLRLWLGSSDYDTRQMSQLIDNLVQECKGAGIETATPEELERMKEEWK